MPASRLHEIQRRLAGLILAPASVDHEAAADFVRRPPRGTKADRLGAYANGYPARLREALEEAYPALRHLLGADTFGEVTRRYRRVVPAGGWDLAGVGRDLPAFLEDDEAARDLPFAADLAHLEWAVQRAFHAHLSPSLPADAFAALATSPAWERTRLRWQAGVAVVESAWPIRALWDARKTPRESIDLELRDRPEAVCVYRVGLRVACEVIDPRHAAVLRRLLDGDALGTALSDLTDEDAPLLTTWTAAWMRHGLIVG